MSTELSKKKSYVFKEPKMYIDYNQNIRISESTNKYKKIVAREISNYMGATSRPWDTLYREDVNSKLLIKHLNDKFSEFSNGYEYRQLPSQLPFDMVSLGCKVIIEVKSVQGHRQKNITSNASIYPDKVSMDEALPKNFSYPIDETLFDFTNPNFEEGTVTDKLDVLVVCVNYVDDVVVGFSIVDGNYWGVNEPLYVACKKLYGEINKSETKNKIFRMLAEDNIFAEAMADGYFGGAVLLDLRKRIELTNPTGRLNVSGKWRFVKI